MPGQQVFVPTVAAHLPSHGHCVQGVAGTYTAHLPWVQISLGAYVTPHAPQYGRFFVRSTQAVLPPTSHGVVSQIAWDRGACSAVLGIAEEIWTSHVVAIGQSAQTRTMGLLAIPVMCASLIAAAAVDRIVAKVKAPSVARGEPAGASVQSASRAPPSDVPVSTTGPTSLEPSTSGSRSNTEWVLHPQATKSNVQRTEFRLAPLTSPRDGRTHERQERE